MRAVVQRVTEAAVRIDGQVVGEITGPGLAVLVGVTHDDGPEQAKALATKIASLRIMREELSVLESGGEVLLVSQFTLYAATNKGRRPTWNAAAPGPVAEPLVDAVATELRSLGLTVATGRFGADMQVSLINDGPVTLLLEL